MFTKCLNPKFVLPFVLGIVPDGPAADCYSEVEALFGTSIMDSVQEWDEIINAIGGLFKHADSCSFELPEKIQFGPAT